MLTIFSEIAEKCFRCGKMITDDETIQVGHRIYHSFCFKCAVINMASANLPFMIITV